MSIFEEMHPYDRFGCIFPSKQSAEFISVSKLCFRHPSGLQHDIAAIGKEC
jgi:hypothetical protein